VRRAAGTLAIALAAAAVLLLLPSPIAPVAWVPSEKPPLAGPWAPDASLGSASLLARGRIRGPEDVAVDAEGRVYAGTADGRIVRVSADGQQVETFAATGGRPLGLRFAPDGRLIVCNAPLGLQAVDPQGRVVTLATEAGGIPIRFADGIDIAADGTIYFSDASTSFGVEDSLFDVLEGRPHGRLLRYDPATQRTAIVRDGLYFANGVALSQHEDFVLVSETTRYRITRLWLAGPRAGTSDVFAENLPAIPDGIAANGKGTFWVAFFTLRNDELDRRLHPHPRAKALLAKLPRAVWPKPVPYGLVAAFDEEGRVLRSLHDAGGKHVRQITTAREHGGVLYFGTLDDDWIGRYPLH